MFLRSEAITSGWTDDALRRCLRTGVLVKVRHGAYTFSDLWERAGARDRHLMLLRAVMRAHPDRVAASHHSGSLLHDLDLWDVPLGRAHVTRLDGGSGRADRDVTHHQGLVLPEDLTVAGGLKAIVPARAALESASMLDVERGLVLVDSGLRRGLFSPTELEGRLGLMASWPDSLRLQLIVRLADGRSGSVGESRCRYLFWSQGLPAPELQYEVFDERGLVGVADFAWPGHRLLGEFDGRVKYERHRREGELSGDVVFREKQREDRMRRATGWGMVRLTWPMLYEAPRAAAYVRTMLQAAA